MQRTRNATVADLTSVARLPAPAHPAEARAPLDEVGQALTLLRLERVVNLGDQADERLAPVLQDGVVARELLAEQDAVEGAAAKRLHDLLAGAAPLAPHVLLQLVAKLLDRRADDQLLGGRGPHVLQDPANEEALPTAHAPRTEPAQAPKVGVGEGRTELAVVLVVEPAPPLARVMAPAVPAVPVPVSVPAAPMKAAAAKAPVVNRPRYAHGRQAPENQTSNHLPSPCWCGASLPRGDNRTHRPLRTFMRLCEEV